MSKTAEVPMAGDAYQRKIYFEKYSDRLVIRQLSLELHDDVKIVIPNENMNDVIGVLESLNNGKRSFLSDQEEVEMYLRYEAQGSWFSPYLMFEWMQNLASMYFNWKVNRKFARIKVNREWLRKKNWRENYH